MAKIRYSSNHLYHIVATPYIESVILHCVEQARYKTPLSILKPNVNENVNMNMEMDVGTLQVHLHEHGYVHLNKHERGHRQAH